MALRISGDGSLNYLDATFNNVTASGLSASGNVVLPSTTEIGAVSSTELGYVDGVTSALQTQLNAKAELSAGYQYHSTLYFTSSGTFTKASYPWLRAIRVKVQGAGGGGGGCDDTVAGNAAAAQGGTAGAYAESFITDIEGLSASVTMTVGAGGTGGAGGDGGGIGAAGTAGGNSSFGATVSANGGSAGSRGADFNDIRWVSTESNQNTATGDFTIAGGAAHVGGRVVGATVTAFAGRGGDSYLGCGGEFRETYEGQSLSGSNGDGYGGGGSGACAAASGSGQNGLAGGNGAAGIVIVELYA